MNVRTTVTMSARMNGGAVKWLALGTLAAGIFDLVFASAFWAIRADVPPVRIGQSIARGLLGDAAYEGGMVTAVLGVGLHFAIIAGMMGAYFLVARRMPVLVRRWLPLGILYGLWLYVAMNYIVVPLSAAGEGSHNALWVGLSVLVHALIGIACAWCSRRALR